MRLRALPHLLIVLALASCGGMDALHRADPGTPLQLVADAGESTSPADSAALVVLTELAVRVPDAPPPQETVATALESLGRRAAAGTLPPAHRLLAAGSAAELALDDLSDASVRMTACDLLRELRDVEALQRVADECADPLVADHAEEALADLHDAAGP